MESEMTSFQLLRGGGEEVWTHFNKMLDIYRHSSFMQQRNTYPTALQFSLLPFSPPTPDLKYATVYSR